MGKAVIVSEQGEGEYTVQIQYDEDRSIAERARLSARLTELDTLIPIAKADLLSIKSEINSLQLELDSKINSGADPEELFKIVESISKKALEARPYKSKVQALEFERVKAVKRIQFIDQNSPLSSPISAWCADYSEGLTGEIGTIEVNGTLDAPPIIYPDKWENNTSGYDSTRDGQIQPVISSGAPAIFFNRAIFPGWQKWLPTFRVGEITSIAGDLSVVNLDQALSSQQDLNINQAGSLSSVPIEYMEQNGSVFEVGDRVVVKFDNQSFDSPKVIGFESNPRPERMVYIMNTGRSNVSSAQGGAHYINRYWPDGTFSKEVIWGYQQNQRVSNLTRVGSRLFYREVTNANQQNYFVKIHSVSVSGGVDTTEVDNSPVNEYAVTRDYIFYCRLDRAIPPSDDRFRIHRHNRSTGSDDMTHIMTGGEQVIDVDANSTHLYVMTIDGGDTNYYRMNHDFTGIEFLGTIYQVFLDKVAPNAAFRLGYRMTDDRVAMTWYPRDFSHTAQEDYENKSYNTYVTIYALPDHNVIETIGPMPRTQIYRDTYTAWTFDDFGLVWALDNGAGNGYFLDYWDRNITKDAQGNIISESYDYAFRSAHDIQDDFSEVDIDNMTR
jgi:hypothetical protein